MARATKAAAPKAPKQPPLARYSPTRLNLYRTCPRAYLLQYDKKLRWGSLTAAKSFGGSLHRTLQDFHDLGGADEVSLDALKARLGERWSAKGYGSDEEAAAFLSAGEQMLEHYHLASREPGRETLGTELTVQRRYDGFVLFGKIDRLDRRPDGALEVIDYKSGRRVYAEDDVRGSLAMTVYQLLVAREHPGVPVYTGIISLRTGDRTFVLRTAEELDAAERDIAALVAEITADTVKAPTPGEQCRTCPYPSACPEGRDWLQRNAG